MLLIDGTFSFATPFCACIFNKHSNALHFILEPGHKMDALYLNYGTFYVNLLALVTTWHHLLS